VQNLPAGPVVFTSGGVELRYVAAAELERLREALVMIYRESPAAVAHVCDGFLDRSGRLLGEIRQEARGG
jgi:hypothetical protein